MNKKVILLIVGVAIVACLCLVAFIAVATLPGILLTQPVATTGDAFMTALKDGDFTKAYDLCAPSLQQELQSAPRLETRIKNAKAQPTQWNFNSQRINNDVGELRGNVTFTGNRTGAVLLTLTKTGNDWKIISFNLNPQ